MEKGGEKKPSAALSTEPSFLVSWLFSHWMGEMFGILIQALEYWVQIPRQLPVLDANAHGIKFIASQWILGQVYYLFLPQAESNTLNSYIKDNIFNIQQLREAFRQSEDLGMKDGSGCG